MNQKKNNKLLIIAIIIIGILIMGIGITYIFVATDIFRSDKEIFFKYIAQIDDEKKGFINSDVTQYFEKKKNTPYETNGKISFNIESSTNQDEVENTNNCNITLKGKVDKANEKSNQEVDINYSGEIKLPLIYQRVGEIIGIQTNYIGSKYIGVKTSQIDKLQTNGINSNNIDITNITNIKDIQISDEQLKYIKDTYYQVLEQELQDNNFSTIKLEDEKAYQLSLSGEELKNIIVKLLETLKNDQITLDKISESISTENMTIKITSEDIEEIIEDLNNNQDFNDIKLQITVHVNNKTVSKLEISINETNLVIEKQETGNSKQYNLSVESNENEKIKVYLNARYSGLQSLQTITEEYELGIETGSDNYIYYYNNEVNFVDSLNIEDFTNDNILILSDYDKEQIETLETAIVERMTQVNKQQMERLGLTEDKNPLQYAIPLLGMQLGSFGSDNQMISNMDEAAINSFNEKFEMYQSSNLKGVTVKGLLSTIEMNNEMEGNQNKIKEINFNGQEYEITEQNITLIKSEVELEAEYRVEFEKDENSGIIYRTVINKK